MADLLGTDWHEKIFTGTWTTGAGDTYDVVEPATGQTLGRLGADEGFDLGGVGGHTHDRPFGNRVQTSPTEDL